MPVRELKHRLSSDEFRHWLAFYRLDPWGDMRADLRSAQIAALTANLWRGKHQRPINVEDFMPYYKRFKPKPTVTELAVRMKNWVKIMTGKQDGS